MVTQRTGTADQNGGSARGCQGLFESLAAWHSRSRPWQADGQGLCINSLSQSRAEGALEISDADTGVKMRPWRSWVLAWDGSLTVSPARGAASPTWPRIQAQRDEVRLRHPNTATAASAAPTTTHHALPAGRCVRDGVSGTARSAPRRRARLSAISRISWPWFQLNAGRATGASRRIHHLVVRTSQARRGKSPPTPARWAPGSASC